MKKLFLFVFLALMFCNIAKATSLTPLIEYFEKNKSTDPAVQVYTFYRCAAVCSFSASLLLKTNEEGAKQFVNSSSNFSLMALTVLVDKLDNEKDAAMKKTTEAVDEISNLYMNDGKRNWEKTGSYFQDSYILDDFNICKKIINK